MTRVRQASVSDLIWGRNFKEGYSEIFSQGGNANSGDAKKVLDAMVLQEARRILGAVEPAMSRGESMAEYHVTPRENLNFINGEEPLVFTSEAAYYNGFYHSFSGLIEAAHPDYSWQSSELGCMKFERR